MNKLKPTIQPPDYLKSNYVDDTILKFRYRKVIFVLFILFIFCLQSYYYFGNVKISPDYRRADATGFNHWWGQEFVYFYHYKGLFPLATADTTKVYSEQGADNCIKNNPKALRMEWGHWSRFGESARIWLYLPYAIWKQTAKEPQIIFTNYIIFTISLLLLFVAFWKIKRPFLGMILCLIIGSSPFMIYEIYINNNVFGLMAAYVILLLSLHLPYMVNKSDNWIILISLITGVLAGIMHQIRAESLPIFISCVLVYFLNKNINLIRRIVSVFILICSFYVTGHSIKNYFEQTFHKTRSVVVKAGAVPFDGGKTLVHPFWHPIYCGLGDYDKKYGHVLHDTDVYNYVLPILRKKTGKALKYPGRTKYEMAEYYDTDSLYYKKPETIEGFDEVVKNRFIEVVTNDPLWYFEIITKRTGDFFFNLSPIGFTFNDYVFKIPFNGILVILLIALLFYFREDFLLKLILFTMPLGISVIIIYSAYNNSYQSIFHFFAFAIIVYFLFGVLFSKRIKSEKSKQ